MQPKPTDGNAASLRQQAETALLTHTANSSNLTVEDMQRVTHELQVNQIELQLQNEELRQAQVELAHSRDRYFDLFELAPIGYLTLNAGTVICEANATAVSLFGVNRSALVGSKFTHFVTPESQDTLYHHRLNVVSINAKQACELMLRKGNGATFPARIETIAIKQSGMDGPLQRCAIIDLSGPKHVAEELRESQERFSQIFENAAIGIAITDWEGHFEECNPAYCSLVGYSQDELRRFTCLQLIHPDDQGINAERLRQIQSGAMSQFEAENRYIRKNGDIVWVRRFISVLRNGNGVPAHILVLTTDVTAKRLIEEALREADRRKDEFLATLSHELRNPLAAIHNSLLMLEQNENDDTTERLCSIMERQTGNLIHLVDDLLEVSRITRGKIELRKERTELAAMIENAVETCRPQFDASGCDVRVSLPTEPLWLDADPVRLSQVFTNLLNNAAKHTESPCRIELTVAREGDEAVVSVRDNGIGIPTEMLGRVFDLFTQINRPLNRVQEGLGIGLGCE